MDQVVKRNAQEMYKASLDKLDSARLLKQSGKYNDSLSRAYYAAFHAVGLLFMMEGQSYSKHSQLIGNFNKLFIATQILPKELGKALGTLYDERQSADYDFYQKSDKTEAQDGIDKAEKIIFTIKEFIEQNYSLTLISETRKRKD